MKKIFTLALLAVTTLFMSGCAQKTIRISAVKPAVIADALHYKTLAVLPIKNDSNGVTNILEQKLLDKQFKGEQIFELASRSEMQSIMNEQAFNSSGAVKEGDRLNLGEIKGVDALIFGEVNDETVRESYYYQTRTECVDKKCDRTVRIRINCTKRNYSTNVTLKMVDVESSKIIVSKTYSDRSSRSVCEDSYYSFASSADIIFNMQRKMTGRFVNMISPTEYTIKATIAEDEPDYDLTGAQEDMLEQANKAFERAYYQKAEKIYKQVISETKGMSYVATYNLGLIYEKYGQLEKAQSLYNTCVNLVEDVSDVPELSQSRVRVTNALKNNTIASNQLEDR